MSGDKGWCLRLLTGRAWPLQYAFWERALLREINVKSNVLPKANKLYMGIVWAGFLLLFIFFFLMYLFSLKLLNSALLQFINQSMIQTAGPDLTSVAGC